MAEDTTVCPHLHLKEAEQAENQEEDRILRHMVNKTPTGTKDSTDNKFGFWLGTPPPQNKNCPLSANLSL